MKETKWILAAGVAVPMLAAGAQGAMVGLWTFDDLNDTSPEDATNDMLALTGDASLADGMLTIAGDGAEGSYASFARSEELNFFKDDTPQAFTFWARYKVSDAGNIAKDYRIIDNYWSDDGMRKGIRFQQNDKASTNSPRIIFGQGGSAYSHIAGASLNLGAKELWSNMAVTFDGSTGGLLYRWNDGEAASLTEAYGATGQTGSGLDTYKILFRKGTDAIGVVDELRIYDTALSQEDLDAIPEPVTFGVMCLGGLTILTRRRT